METAISIGSLWCNEFFVLSDSCIKVLGKGDFSVWTYRQGGQSFVRTCVSWTKVDILVLTEIERFTVEVDSFTTFLLVLGGPAN